MTRIVAVAIVLLAAASHVRAQQVTDGFDGPTPNPVYWGADEIDGQGGLLQTNQRLEYIVASPTFEDQATRPWILGAGPYASSWEVRIDLANDTTPGGPTQNDSFGIDVTSSKDDTDYFYAELYVSSLQGPPRRSGFHAALGADDIPVGPGSDTGDLAVTRGAVRIVFDGATKVLTAYYDVDPADGYTWVPFASYGLAGGGGIDGNANFALSDADQFRIAVYGFSTFLGVTGGQMYGDDFTTVGFVPISSGVQLKNTDHDHEWSQDPVIPYELEVTNLGADRDDLVLRDIVPVGTTFSAADSTPGWLCAGGPGAENECTLPVGPLASGMSFTATFAARVDEGTSPAFDIFNEASTNPRAADDTVYALCLAFVPENQWCCISKYIAYFGCISCLTAAATMEDTVDLELQYRVRDRVFRKNAGGRRVTDLFYAHRAELLAAALAAPSVAMLAKENLLAWQPNLRALVEGGGAAVTVTAGQVDGLVAFLDALRPTAAPRLQEAIDRERALADLPSWVGLTMDQALARLDALSCERAPTFASAACRFDELGRLTAALVPPGKLATRLAKAAKDGKRWVDKAAALTDPRKRRPRRAAVGKAARAASQYERKLASKLGAGLGDAKAVLLATSGPLREDLATLRAQ
jgi:hypothetical protein